MAGTDMSNLSPSARSLTRTGSPPWTQIVRGPESDVVGAPSSPPELENPVDCSDNGAGGGNAGGKKPVWNKKPPNEAPESGLVVMGPAEVWPALSESTKASPKLSSSDSSKSLPDFGSFSAPQVIGTESSSSSISSPVQSVSHPLSNSQKPSTSNSNHNLTPNHGRPTRQKSMKRDGGNSQANGGFPHQPAAGDSSHNLNHSSIKPGFGGGSEGSRRDNMQNHDHREFGPRNASGDHPHPRGPFRRGNGGPHSRGDGSHQNYGGRRGDQDRGNHDWNHHRSFNGREAPMQPRVAPRGIVRPPPVSAPFVHSAPVGPFMNPVGIPDMHAFYLHPGMPLVAPVPAPMYYLGPDPQLDAKIVNQIDYYFSNENLIRDTYLRQNMDENGWVPIALIASFKKVMQLTENIQQILNAVKSSTIVEVQGDKIRKRDGWRRWIMPPSVQFPTASGVQSPKTPTVAALSAHIQSFTVDEKIVDHNNPKGQVDVNAATLLRSSSGDLNSPLQTTKNEASSSGC